MSAAFTDEDLANVAEHAVQTMQLFDLLPPDIRAFMKLMINPPPSEYVLLDLRKGWSEGVVLSKLRACNETDRKAYHDGIGARAS